MTEICINTNKNEIYEYVKRNTKKQNAWNRGLCHKIRKDKIILFKQGLFYILTQKNLVVTLIEEENSVRLCADFKLKLHTGLPFVALPILFVSAFFNSLVWSNSEVLINLLMSSVVFIFLYFLCRLLSYGKEQDALDFLEKMKLDLEKNKNMENL